MVFRAGSAHRSRLLTCLPTLTVLFVVAVVPLVMAEDPVLSVVAVEEDWELVVQTPDPNSDAPQVTCVMSPVDNVDSIHAALDINHQSLPHFLAGGLQLQVWNGELAVSERKFPNGNIMSQENERVAWTQRMELSEGALVFEIRNGTSSTWGDFGGQGYLRSSVDSPVGGLSQYNPLISLKHSAVGFAGNRVQSLTLKKVRWIYSNGAVAQADPELKAYPKD